MLALQDPSMDQILAFWKGEKIQNWPPWFGRSQSAFREDPLYDCLGFCLDQCSAAGLCTGRDACRLVAAVAQTLCCTNIDLAKRNRSLVPQMIDQLPLPPGSESGEADFVKDRPDERGARLLIENASLWLGSHVGPADADKCENQDAVWAVPCSGGLVFALADGVSTSLESRDAAAIIAHRFCQEAVRLYVPTASMQEVLLEAARSTQQYLDNKLEKILADPTGAEATDLLRRSELGETTTWIVLSNTKSEEKDFLQPAMASTLIGGFLLRSATDEQFNCTVLCLGDGAIELLTKEGTIDQKLITDPEVTQISQSLGPGPRSRVALEGENVMMIEFSIPAGQWLLISSDGLARGHSNTIWEELTQVVGNPREVLARSGDTGAIQLLSEAAKAAFQRGDQSLFSDNLSLIVVEVN